MASLTRESNTTNQSEDNGTLRSVRRTQSTAIRLLKHRSGAVGGGIIIALIIIAIFGPFLTPYDPTKMEIMERLTPPSMSHWFGTDEFGRDILTRVMYGARITLMIGAISVVIGITVGGIMGLAAGYFGGAVDMVISVITDILLAFPNFLLALAIISALGPSLENAVIAVGVRTIPLFSRIVRASTIAVRENEYVTAARTNGAGTLRIVLKHIVPNIAAPLVVLASLEFPAAVLVAAGLSFLGLGAQPPSPEWGSMLVGARELLRTAPWAVNAPGIAIMVTVLGFNLLGNALRDILDPRLRKG